MPVRSAMVGRAQSGGSSHAVACCVLKIDTGRNPALYAKRKVLVSSLLTLLMFGGLPAMTTPAYAAPAVTQEAETEIVSSAGCSWSYRRPYRAGENEGYGVSIRARAWTTAACASPYRKLELYIQRSRWWGWETVGLGASITRHPGTNWAHYFCKNGTHEYRLRIRIKNRAGDIIKYVTSSAVRINCNV